jgi:hypothetical protein
MAKTKLKRPTRDEFELEELGNKIVEAKEEGNEMLFTVWGMSEQVRGRITELDARTRLVHIEQQLGVVEKIPFLDIMRLDSPRY